MENNFIQRSALGDHAVAYTIGIIFKHIGLYAGAYGMVLNAKPRSRTTIL